MDKSLQGIDKLQNLSFCESCEIFFFFKIFKKGLNALQ